MNAHIRRLGIGLLALYVALFVQLNRLQVFGAQRLNEHEANTRPIVRDFDRPRGTITTADGVVIARSAALPPGGSFDYERVYPEGDLYGHVTGFFSFNFGAAGLEDVYNDFLSGQATELRYGDLDDLFSDNDKTGDLQITIRHDLQSIAREQLAGRRGSVVALDPRTGAILAVYSNPSYDPTYLSQTRLELASQAWALLNTATDNPLLARSYRETFAPGSTFKVVTAAAGLTSGRVTLDQPVYPQLSDFTPLLTNRPLRNFDGNVCGGSLLEVLRVSCNTSFAQMGTEDIGPEPLVAQAEAFGFNEEPPIDLPSAATSRVPTDYGAPIAPLSAYRGTTTTVPGAPPSDEVRIYEDNPRLAQVAIGQNDVAATPLQMALVAAAVGNGGVIMNPHLLGQVADRTGDVVESGRSEEWKRPLTAAVAAQLRSAMVGVVDSGTARRLAVDGFEVGGKTGTAQTGANGEKAHAWIIGFGGLSGEPAQIAVAVIVEAQDGVSEQTGGRVAAPIAQAVLQAALVGA